MKYFLGLQSYDFDQDNKFGGRDKDIYEIYKLISDNNFLLLFGKSGIGKTSILKAGLFNRIKDDFVTDNIKPLPIFIRISFQDKKSPLWQLEDKIKETIYKQNIKSYQYFEDSLENKTLRKEIPVEGNVWEFLHGSSIEDDKYRYLPILIFDQFEEIFNSNIFTEKNEKLITTLANLIENRLPKDFNTFKPDGDNFLPQNYQNQYYKIIISIREDYLPFFESFKPQIPSIFSTVYRLKRFDEDNAFDAIYKTSESKIEPDIIDLIVNKVKMPNRNAATRNIEPFILSLYCSQLEKLVESRDEDISKIDKDLITSTKIEHILEAHYEKETTDEEKEFIENHLITNEGKRKLILQSEAEKSLSKDIIENLIKKRIIKKEIIDNTSYIELTHDKYSEPVLAGKKNRIEKEIYEKELLIRKKKYRRIARYAGLLTILFSFIFISIMSNNNRNEILMQLLKIRNEKTVVDTIIEEKEKKIEIQDEEIKDLLNKIENLSETIDTQKRMIQLSGQSEDESILKIINLEKAKDSLEKVVQEKLKSEENSYFIVSNFKKENDSLKNVISRHGTNKHIENTNNQSFEVVQNSTSGLFAIRNKSNNMICSDWYQRIDICIAATNRNKVKKFGKFGFIDNKGNEVIQCKYKIAYVFNDEGKAKVSLTNVNEFFYIDINGNRIE